MLIIREACVEIQKEIDVAALNKAERIELCSRLDLGGYTPDLKLIDYSIKTSIPTIIMIRRKNNNYVTNFWDMFWLKKHIKKTVNTPIKGFVFGLLTKDNHVDVKNMKKLIALCNKKEVVFHMAFDLIENKKEAIDILSSIGVTRILTKGGANTAEENIDTLKELIAYAKNKIEIVVGGKVTDDNYLLLNKKTNATQFHGRKLAVKKAIKK